MVRTLVVSARAVVLLAVLCAVGASAGGLGWPPALGVSRHDSSAAGPAGPALAEWVVASPRGSAGLGVDLAGTHPQVAGVLAAVVGLWLLVSAARSGLAAASPKDLRRAYSRDERQAGFDRAGQR